MKRFLILLLFFNTVALAAKFPGAPELSSKKLKALKAADKVAAWRVRENWGWAIKGLEKLRKSAKDSDPIHLYVAVELAEIYSSGLRELEKADQEIRAARKLMKGNAFTDTSLHLNFSRLSRNYEARYFDYVATYRNINRAQLATRLNKISIQVNTALGRDLRSQSHNVASKLRRQISKFEAMLGGQLSDLDRAKILARLSLYNFRLNNSKAGSLHYKHLASLIGEDLYQNIKSDRILKPIYQAELFIDIGDSHMSSNRFSHASRYYQEAIHVFERFRSSISSEADRISLFSNLDLFYEKLIIAQYENKDSEGLLSSFEKTKARTFSESLFGEIKEELTGAYRVNSEKEVLQNLISSLDNSSAILSFYTSEKSVYSALITKKGIQVNRSDIAKNELEKLVESLFKVEEESVYFSGSDNTLKLLGLKLFEAHEKAIQNLDQLLIIPHGALHSIPIDALKLNDKYLIEHVAVSYAPSIQVYEEFRGRKFSDVKYKVLAYGNPSYPMDTVPDLPGALLEAKRVVETIENSQSITGNKATESHFYENASSASIIHLATHGKFIAKNPMSSVLLLASDVENDGFLQAEDLTSLNLSNNKLFVMSACETSMEQVLSGDDLFGFTRSLSQSGTGSILSALWSIGDESTLILMQEFYKELKLGTQFSKALQSAKKKLMLKYPDPYHWASFRLIGNGQLKLNTKRQKS